MELIKTARAMASIANADGEVELTRIFTEVAREFGYVDVIARYADLRPMELRMSCRTPYRPEIEVSRELMDAPEHIRRGFARGLFGSFGNASVSFDRSVTEYIAGLRTTCEEVA